MMRLGALGVPQLGGVGEVTGEADACLGHGPAPSCWLAGRAAPPLGRGPVDTVAGVVGGALAAGVGHARNRPARSLHPGAWWENEATTMRASCSSSQAAGRS